MHWNYQRNPIDWSVLNWLKAILVSTLSSRDASLATSEVTMLREVLAVIAEDYPEHRDYANYLLAQLPWSGTLWIPTGRDVLRAQHQGLEHQVRQAYQDAHQLWWEVYHFLMKFEERPAGKLLLARPTRHVDLAHLEQQVKDGNEFAVPDYIWTHLNKTGQPPNMYFPNIIYFCETHQIGMNPGWMLRYGNAKVDCQTARDHHMIHARPHQPSGMFFPNLQLPCRIIPQVTGLDDWLSSMTFKNNLFALKKREFSQPTTAKKLLQRFFDLHRQEPAYLLLPQQVEDYFRNFLREPMEVIAELNIVPRQAQYYLKIPISWVEIVQLTNLRDDLVQHSPLTQYFSYTYNKNSIGYLPENHHPRTILSFGALYKSSRGNYESSALTQGVVLRDEDNVFRSGPHKVTKATCEAVTFG